MNADNFIALVESWASTQPEIRAIALVGSYARKTARPESDIDLVLLASDRSPYLSDTSWLAELGSASRTSLEQYGRVTSVRAFFDCGLDVEFAFATPDWAGFPIDPGTRSVVENGFQILFDPDGILEKLVAGLKRPDDR